jgi:uncharacterized SAM-binding protein YcdF (DUF218 family)
MTTTPGADNTSAIRGRKILRRMGQVMRGSLMILGLAFLIFLVLAFTRIPYDLHRGLALRGGTCSGPVDLIIVLGGSGMPSGPELLRLHHAALEAGISPQARVVVIHPLDTAVMEAMLAELVLKGVDRERITPLYEGTNTREQALVVAGLEQPGIRAALVTAPENMYRSLGAFRKAGLEQVCGAPAFDHAMFVDLHYDHRRIGGRRMVPDVSSSHSLRYDFWNDLKLEIVCLREYVAIAYYKANGWM